LPAGVYGIIFIMNYKVFIIEDDKGIAGAISNCIALWDMESCISRDFHNIMPEFAKYDPHLVLLDIGLPFMDGYHWCREIRKISSVPIIFISSATENMNIVMAMNMGADDFIVKPFDQSVLVAKMQAVLRRAYDFVPTSPVIEHKGVFLNLGDNTLSYGNEKLDLSKNEYKILLTLMRNKGKVVSREKLMEALWETDCYVDENTLTVNIGRLRKKLESIGIQDLISTRFGIGYIIEE